MLIRLRNHSFPVYHGTRGQAMITYFKVPLSNLFPVRHTLKAIKVKTLIFRNNNQTRSIDVVSLDARDRFVCYEQWSIPGNEQDYLKCREELRSFTGRSMYPPVGKWVFEKYKCKIKKAVMQSTAQTASRPYHTTGSDMRERKALL